MTLKHYVTCDACGKDIMSDDAPHLTRQEFVYKRVEKHSEQEFTDVLPRRDLHERCAVRIRQALIQAPKSVWLLDGFKVQKK